MRDISQQQQYWNWTLSAWTYNWYNNIVNFDIVAPTYTFNRSKKRPTSFFLKKRKWYQETLPTAYAQAYRDWEVTDIIELKDWACWDESSYLYLFIVNKNTRRVNVLIRRTWCENSTDWHDLCWFDWLDPTACYECFCSCWYDRFFVTDFVKWTPRTLSAFWIQYGSLTWVQENTNNWTVWTFYDLDIKYFDNINIWDYIYVSESPNQSWDAVCWQARQVVWIDYRTALRDYDILTLNAPWVWLWTDVSNTNNYLVQINTAKQDLYNAIQTGNAATILAAQTKLDWLISVYESDQKYWVSVYEQKWINAWYSIYPEWGQVVSFSTCEWIQTIHSPFRYRDADWNVVENFIAQRTTACSWFTNDVCTYSITEYNSRINMLGSSWFNIYWWLAYDKFYFSSDNLNSVWENKVSQVVFRNFLVQFWLNSMSVIVSDTTWNTFSYQIDSTRWIFSRNAFCVFQNSLYVVWWDKRLYSCDIVSSWQWLWYQLILNDQSQQVRWDLELMSEWDEVSIENDWVNLMIFINSKYNITDWRNIKTKILIYNRDYNRWMQHHICHFNIKRMSMWYYLWDSLYEREYTYQTNQFPISKDTDSFSWEVLVTSYIDAYIGENEDGSNWQLSLYAKKTPKRAKIILWKWIYTDGSTKLVIDSSSFWWSYQYQADKFEHIKWIDDNNDYWLWWDVMPDECTLESLSECTNVVWECTKSLKEAIHLVDSVWCRFTEEIYNDNCICINDKTFALSDTYNIYFNLSHLKSWELFRFRIISEWWDMMNFGWMMVWFLVNDISTNDADNADLANWQWECCVEWKYIEKDIICPCS